MGPLFVVSDVHGHRDDLFDGLVSAGLVSVEPVETEPVETEPVESTGQWCGGDAELWILGDLTDRGPDGIGVLDLVMSLQAQAPGQVHVLMGNHEALALGRHRFPESRFADSWRINGGQSHDQDALTETHLDWLSSLPLVARVGDYLLMHADTTAYLSWGDSIEEINQTVGNLIASHEFDGHWDVWARLTSRYHFSGRDGAEVARQMLDTLGGEVIVHGHSIIGSLIGRASSEVDAPALYAQGLVLAVDGGRYDGGPLLVVRLD